MGIFTLFLLWSLTFLLGRWKRQGVWRFSCLIPGMVFFRVSLTAALLSHLVAASGLQGDFVRWLAVVARTGFYVAFAELVLDLTWVVVTRINRRRVAPPRILRDLAFVAAVVVIVAAELSSQGLLTTVGSAAVLGGLAFLVGPGAASQIGNISAALAVQAERQFEVGDWVEIAGERGRVDNISWNSTYLYDDRLDRIIVVPNSLIDDRPLINYSRPSSDKYRLELEIGLPVELAPGKAAVLLVNVLEAHGEVMSGERIVVTIGSVNQDSINYILKFFISDFARGSVVRSAVFSSIWYAVERAGYAFPRAVVDLHTARSKRQSLEDLRRLSSRKSFEHLRANELLSSLSDAEVSVIIDRDRLLNYGVGEMLVVAGDLGGSMYVIVEGSCSVLIPDPSGGEGLVEAAQLHAGGIFGELSALTNAPRAASIQALSHVVVQEISQRQIEAIFLGNEAAMAEFAKVMAQREAERKALSAEQTEEFELGLVERMTKTFSRLMFR